MKKFKGMTFEQCRKYVEKMNSSEKLKFFTIKIDKANFCGQENYKNAYKSLPDLIIVHSWWAKI